MRVFVTGGTGYLGSAVVRALVEGGHRVASLSRSPERDAIVAALGAEPVRGSLPDLPGLSARLAEHDALVHLAIDYGLGPAGDRAAVEALLGAARAAREPRLVVYTSGVWVLGETAAPAGEDASTARPAAAVAWRPAHERLVLDSASGSLATAVVRPGIVWGEKRGLFIGFMESARKDGAAAHVGGGQNRWPPVHREDAAALYRLLVERRARGVYHAVDGTAPRVSEMARALSEAAGAKGAIRSIPIGEARKTMGPMADALAMDQVVVAPRSAEVGWKPRRPSFPEAARAAYAEWTG